MFSSLPPEIILKIFSLLPGKKLQNLRLVSKQFNSLISVPYLLHLHHRRALNSFSILTAFTRTLPPTLELRLFLFTKPNLTETPIAALTAFHTSLTAETIVEQTQKPITKRFLGPKLRVFSSNHQFICFVSEQGHFLFDPINQKTLKLPQSSYYSSSSFYPLGVISFGFVSSTLQYKIIRFFLPYHPVCKLEILTVAITANNYNHHLEISPWKSQEVECPYLLQPYPPVHADGFLYWTTKYVPMIVSFSLQQENFSVLPPPICFEENPNHDFSLCGIRGNLWVVDYNSVEPSMEIWMMSGSAWVKTHRIELKETLTRYYRTFPIKIHDINSDCVVFQILFPSRIMKMYHTHKNEVESFGELYEELHFCHYTDGLLSL